MNAENLLNTKLKKITAYILLLIIATLTSLSAFAIPDKIIEETIIPIKPKPKPSRPIRQVPKIRQMPYPQKNIMSFKKKSKRTKKVAKKNKIKVTKTSIKEEKNLATKPESLVINSEKIENKNKNFISENKYMIIFFALLPIVVIIYFLKKRKKKLQPSTEEEIDYEFME